MPKLVIVAVTGLLLLLLQGCTSGQGCCEPRCEPACGWIDVTETSEDASMASTPTAAEPEPAPAAKAATEALYDGTGGQPESLLVAADAWKDAHLIAFGELHGHPVGAKHQLALLQALHEQEKPIALAMEFFERDMQAVVDSYLQGEIDSATLQKKTRKGAAYARTHGPLIDYCKENDIPVIAANAPRRLVTAYRKQGEDYETWKASLSAEDQGYLPEETSIVEDEYRAKFMKFMGEERGARIFKAQSLWDDAMAEAITDFREEHPAHRVLLIVGAFHVTKGLGTITKYRMRRAKDEVRILTMTMSADPSLAFEDADLGLGDLVLKVPRPVRRMKMGKTPKKVHVEPDAKP